MYYDTTIITKVMNFLGHIYQGRGKETKLPLAFTLATFSLIWEAKAEVLEDFIPW